MFNILNKIDLKKLDQYIQAKDKINYIVMNHKTFEEIRNSEEGSDRLDLARNKFEQIDYCVYNYIGRFPIAFCEKLNYGEVDLI